MKQSKYNSYDDLPLFFNAETVAAVLGIAPSSAYELMHEKDFPALHIGSRIVGKRRVPRVQAGNKNQLKVSWQKGFRHLSSFTMA